MIVLITTYPNNSRQLKKFIIGVLKSGAAKCVNRINYVKSYYIWEGEIKQEEEKILFIKTAIENKEKLEKYVLKNHPYKTPEIIWIKPDDIGSKYLEWINTKEIFKK